jgi:serine/arginine repetitive matrix protein 2
VKKENAEIIEGGTVKKSKSKSKSKSKTKKKTDKGEDEDMANDQDQDQDDFKAPTKTPDLSSSSFEVGSLSPILPRVQAVETQSQSLGKKKRSILGLGLPSGMSMSMRLPKVRSSSSSSSTIAASNAAGIIPNANGQRPAAGGRLSVESASHMFTVGRDRVSSTSTSSSLRPMSITSTVSGVGSRHSSGSGGSIRWDEERLESVIAIRRRERLQKEREREREKVREMAEAGKDAKGKKDKKGSRKDEAGSRRRTPLSEVFLPDPDVQRDAPKKTSEPVRYKMVEVPTPGRHSAGNDESSAGESVEGDEQGVAVTPVKRARPRPLSEHSFSGARPKAMYESDDSMFFLFWLSLQDLELMSIGFLFVS